MPQGLEGTVQYVDDAASLVLSGTTAEVSLIPGWIPFIRKKDRDIQKKSHARKRI